MSKDCDRGSVEREEAGESCGCCACKKTANADRFDTDMERSLGRDAGRREKVLRSGFRAIRFFAAPATVLVWLNAWVSTIFGRGNHFRRNGHESNWIFDETPGLERRC